MCVAADGPSTRRESLRMSPRKYARATYGPSPARGVRSSSILQRQSSVVLLLISIQDTAAVLADEIRAAAQLAGHLRRDFGVAGRADAALHARESVGALGGGAALGERPDVL